MGESLPRRSNARLPLEPLEAAVTREHDLEPLEVVEFAARIHRDPSVLYYWRNSGGITVKSAEEVCDFIGHHPFLVWGDAYYEACGFNANDPDVWQKPIKWRHTRNHYQGAA